MAAAQKEEGEAKGMLDIMEEKIILMGNKVNEESAA